jgi:phosphonatase-like hydrolase
MGGIDLVVFDLAGTTVEDRGEVLAAFREALEKNQIPAPADFIQRWRGAAKKEVLRLCVEERFGKGSPGQAEKIDRTYADFRLLLEDRYLREGVHPLPGAAETFRRLRKKGIRIAFTTGFYRKVADLIFERLGWKNGPAEASVCSDEVPRGRPAPYLIFRAMEAARITDVRRVVNVGDTALDLLSASNAGVRGNIGVLTGSQGIDLLGKVQHTHILPSVAELPELLEKEFA